MRNRILAIALSLILGQTEAIAQGQATHSKLLRGGVEHSEAFPALPDYLKTGAIFDQSFLTQAPKLDKWYQIPSWLAGEWLQEQETVTFTYDCNSHEQSNEPKTIMARETAQFGVQTDRQGGIWHCRIAAGGVADCGSYYSVALLSSQEPVEVSEDKVVIRSVFTEIRVAKETNVIILALQAESFSTYHPVRDGVLKTSTSVKFFEEDGSPKNEQRNVALDERTASFKPLNLYKGRDLRKSFKEFLLQRGLPELVPADTTTQTDD
jgi:hypothetical protein